MATGNVNICPDLVIGKHLEEKAIHIADIGVERWFEIDTVEDLGKAGDLFNRGGNDLQQCTMLG